MQAPHMKRRTYLVMFGMVDIHGSGIYIGLQGGIIIREGGESEGHAAFE